MPYNPQIQDRSGEILAQGMRAQSQGIASGIGSGIQNFMKLEEERRKTTGAIQGMLNDPYFQQQLAKDPTMSAAAAKIQSGKANLNDVQQFLGSLTSMQFGRQQQMKDQQMQMDRDRLAMEQQNAVSTRAYQQGQLDAIRRKEEEAKRISDAMAKTFGSTIEETEEITPETKAYLEEMGLGADAAAPVIRRRPPTSAEGMRAYAATGAPITPGVVESFGMLRGEEMNRARDATEREKIERRAADAELRAQTAEARMNISTDPVIAQVEKMLAQKLITEEQAQTKIMDRIDFLNTRKVDSMEKLANALTGEGVGSNTGRSTTRPGGTTGTTGTPAVNRFLGQR
jgi:hypothetical protein